MVRTHSLDLTPDAPRSYNLITIQLLIKDTGNAFVSKGSSWHPEAIPYGVSFRVAFYYPSDQDPYLGPDPRCPQVLKPHHDLVIK